MRARACLLVLLLAVVCAGPAKAVDYCVYLAEFRGTGCPVTIPPGQTSASANICIECPTSWNGVCKNFNPTVPHKIRGTDCVAYMDTPDPNSSNCGTCPSGLAKYKREVDDGFSVCSLPVDDGLDDDHDGLIDEEFCDGLDNDGDGLIDE